MEEGYFDNGRWIESNNRIASHELKVIDDMINNNVSIKLDGQLLKLKSYLISHNCKEFPNIVLELSDNTKLDVNVVTDDVDLRIGNTRYIAEDQTKLDKFLETPVLEKTIIEPDKIIDVFDDGVILPRTHVKDGEEAYIQQQLSNFKDTGIFKVYDPVIPDDLKVKLDKNGNIVDEHGIQQSVSQQKQGLVKRLRNLINV